MNKEAEKHLATAKEYLAQGDEFYRKARPEIQAAVAAGVSQREVARYLAKSHSWVQDVIAWDGTGTLYGHDTEQRQIRQARQVLRESTPEEIAEKILSEPKIRQNVGKAQDVRHVERKQRANDAFREEVGDETADGLELKEQLQSTEYLLIKARGNLRGFVRELGEIGTDSTPDAWQQSCLDWLNDLEGHIGMAKALLSGHDIDWSQFDELLEKGA